MTPHPLRHFSLPLGMGNRIAAKRGFVLPTLLAVKIC